MIVSSQRFFEKFITVEANLNVSMVIQVGKFIQGLEVFVLVTYEIATVLKIVVNLLSSK